MSIIDIAKSVVTGSPVDVLVALVDEARARTPDAHRDPAFQEQINDICLQLAQEWSEEKHRNKQPPLREDVEKGALRLADAYHEARNNKKRRMLYQAFYSYFRPEFYDEAISEMLWEKVQNLEYPDLVLLDKVLKQTHPEKRSALLQEGGPGGRGTWRASQLPIYEASEDAECAERLQREGLVSLDTNDSQGVILVSWRGLAKRMRDFALSEFESWKPDQPKGEAPSNEPKQGK